MKHLLLIVFSVSLLSCSNKKEEIVEQIKAYKDSLGTVAQREAKFLDGVMRIQEKYVGQQSLDSVRAFELAHAKEKASITTDRIIFESKIDSLELELKKY